MIQYPGAQSGSNVLFCPTTQTVYDKTKKSNESWRLKLKISEFKGQVCQINDAHPWKCASVCRSHPLVDGGHGRVRVTVAAWSVANLPVGQPLIGGSLRPGRDDTQNLQLELQGVVRRGGGQADAGYLLRGLDGQRAFGHQLWAQEGDREGSREKTSQNAARLDWLRQKRLTEADSCSRKADLLDM